MSEKDRLFCTQCANTFKRLGADLLIYHLEPESQKDTYKICIYSIECLETSRLGNMIALDEEQAPDKMFTFKTKAEFERGMKLFHAMLEFEMLEEPPDGMYH